MSEAKDIKEVLEVLEGVFTLYDFMKKEAEDGLDWSDAGALVVKLVDDEDFRNKLVDAFEGYAEIGEEVKDLSFSEGIKIVEFIVNKLK